MAPIHHSTLAPTPDRIHCCLSNGVFLQTHRLCCSGFASLCSNFCPGTVGLSLEPLLLPAVPCLHPSAQPGTLTQAAGRDADGIESLPYSPSCCWTIAKAKQWEQAEPVWTGVVIDRGRQKMNPLCCYCLYPALVTNWLSTPTNQVKVIKKQTTTSAHNINFPFLTD